MSVDKRGHLCPQSFILFLEMLDLIPQGLDNLLNKCQHFLLLHLYLALI